MSDSPMDIYINTSPSIYIFICIFICKKIKPHTHKQDHVKTDFKFIRRVLLCSKNSEKSIIKIYDNDDNR